MHRRHVLALALVLTPAAASAGENLMLVLDASGSMWGRVDGRTKVEVARETVADVIARWNPENALGLVAYGHRRKGDCADIETLVAPGPLDAEAYLGTVNALNALGMTPLSAAVQHAAAALKSSEQKATVILVSDGEETCNLDPCAVGTALEQAGVDFTAHVIGFDVANPQHQAQLRCLAENTGGRYFNARDAAELGAAIAGAVSASTEPPPPPATATLVARGPVAISALVEIEWRGPADRGDYITFAPKGSPDGDYLDYRTLGEADRAAGGGLVTLRAPATAGTYELRYASPLRTPLLLARIDVQIADAEASVSGPTEAMAGDVVSVQARGPLSGSHWIGFAPAGSGPGDYRDYGRPQGEQTALVLTAPSEPGDYELRYVLNEAERVIAAQPIRIVAARASVAAPTQVAVGEAIEVRFEGPRGNNAWVGFVPAGGDADAYLGYFNVAPDTTSPSTLQAPPEAGRYDLIYFAADRVLARTPVEVR